MNRLLHEIHTPCLQQAPTDDDFLLETALHCASPTELANFFFQSDTERRRAILQRIFYSGIMLETENELSSMRKNNNTIIAPKEGFIKVEENTKPTDPLGFTAINALNAFYAYVESSHNGETKPEIKQNTRILLEELFASLLDRDLPPARKSQALSGLYALKFHNLKNDLQNQNPNFDINLSVSQDRDGAYGVGGREAQDDLDYSSELAKREGLDKKYLFGLEYRDNPISHKKFLDTSIPANIIQSYTEINTNSYTNLSIPDRKKLLTTLLKEDADISWFDLQSAQKDDNVKKITERILIAKDNPEAIQNYIISELEGAENILEVLVILKLLGFENGMNIVPQPESPEEIIKTPQTIEELLSIPEYRKHLETKGNEFMIMAGHSDSTKRGGLAMRHLHSNALQEAVQIAFQQGIKVNLHLVTGKHHGRGGGAIEDVLLRCAVPDVNNLSFAYAGNCAENVYALSPHALKSSIGAIIEANQNPNYAKGLESQRSDAAKILAPVYRRYRDLFYKNVAHQQFLTDCIPFHIVEKTISQIDSRPMYRSDAPKVDEIRALSYIFANSLAGFHPYIIGAKAFNNVSVEKNKENIFLQQYMRDLSYGLAVTDIDHLWKMSGFKKPLTRESIQKIAQDYETNDYPENDASFFLLCWIDQEIYISKNIAYSFFNENHKENRDISNEELLAKWSNLQSEVEEKQELLRPLKGILEQINSPEELNKVDSQTLLLLYQSFLHISDMPKSMIFNLD